MGDCLKRASPHQSSNERFVHGSEIDSLAEVANSLSKSLEATQQQSVSGLLGLAEDVKAYLQLLGSFLDQQTHFVSDRKLTKQKVLLFLTISSSLKSQQMITGARRVQFRSLKRLQ